MSTGRCRDLDSNPNSDISIHGLSACQAMSGFGFEIRSVCRPEDVEFRIRIRIPTSPFTVCLPIRTCRVLDLNPNSDIQFHCLSVNRGMLGFGFDSKSRHQGRSVCPPGYVGFWIRIRISTYRDYSSVSWNPLSD